MLKQFNLELLAFRDPQEPEEGWIDIETQEEINAISESITNNGKVWVEDGKIRCSGKAPSEFHAFNLETKLFEISSERMATLLAERKAKMLIEVANKTDDFKAQYLVGYSQAEIDSFYRQEREARGELPLMLLTEIFEGRDDLESIEQLKKKVIDKADLLAIIMGKLFAVKQNFEKHIEEAQTLEELVKIQQEIDKWQKL
ncbi:phage tail protein [Haemophilus sputorum]|uniref:phage tail protein n=1 Tax=Haemophilus sputorum TaxID=1078480 RepID=UPI0028D0377C|nr:phage tail protein [Haemophilus sputorum]